jgi:ABC-type glycerol-3-phosphate transport system substrate-binding protein
MKGKAVILLLVLAFLAGCGGPKVDVSVFIYPKEGISAELTKKMEDSLKAKIGASPTVEVVGAPIFDMQKLVVEVAAGGHGILIFPAEQFQTMGIHGEYVSLDSAFKAEDYPDGVLNVQIEDKDGKAHQEKHLYGIPMKQSKWFSELGLKGGDLIAFIPGNAPDPQKALEVLKVIAGQ